MMGHGNSKKEHEEIKNYKPFEFRTTKVEIKKLVQEDGRSQRHLTHP
ncbi:unnamed protein product [Brassica oleracea var. botrytis]